MAEWRVASRELIVGGQKSGKSVRAECLARAWLQADAAHDAILLATALALVFLTVTVVRVLWNGHRWPGFVDLAAAKLGRVRAVPSAEADPVRGEHEVLRGEAAVLSGIHAPADGVDHDQRAGAVVGAMKLIAGRKARANVVAICALVENMPDGNAQRPGDVVRSMSGQTVEVINTDAEGRLILCDAMWYAQEKFKPQAMVELSTLTGAIIVALGHERAGMFSNNTQLSNRLRAAGAGLGEKLWRMPLGPKYDKLIDSDIADMKNVSNGRDGGSITAAQFLQRFVQDGLTTGDEGHEAGKLDRPGHRDPAAGLARLLPRLDRLERFLLLGQRVVNANCRDRCGHENGIE